MFEHVRPQRKEVPMTEQLSFNYPVPEGYEMKFVSFITTKSGKRLYAKAYGKRAWPILVKVT
jgi:hypothetical protein